MTVNNKTEFTPRKVHLNRIIPSCVNYLVEENEHLEFLMEKGGAFPNQYKIVDYLSQLLEKKIKKKDGDLIDISNKIYRYSFIYNICNSPVIFIVLTQKNKSGVALGNAATSLDTKDIIVKINIQYNDLRDCLSTFRQNLVHELLHVYEDYVRKQTNVESLVDIIQQNNYNSIAKLAANDSENYVRAFYDLLYVLFPFEINANVSNIYTDLFNSRTTKDTFKNNIFKCPSYTRYSSLLYDGIPFFNEFSDEMKHNVANKFESFSGITIIDKNKWFDKIIKNAEIKLQDVLKKMQRNGMIYYYDVSESFNPLMFANVENNIPNYVLKKN